MCGRSPMPWLALLLSDVHAVNRDNPSGRGLIKRDALIPSVTLSSSGLEIAHDANKLNVNGSDPALNGTKPGEKEKRQSASKYQGWAAAADLLRKAGFDPNAPPPDPFAGIQESDLHEPQETQRRASSPSRKVQVAGLLQDATSDGDSDGSVTMSVDASGAVMDSVAVAVYDETLPPDQITYGGRRRAHGQSKINAAVKRIQQEVDEEGEAEADECYNEWTSWDLYRCVHRECGGISKFTKKRTRRLKTALLLEQQNIRGCDSKPWKNVHLAVCDTEDTMEATGMVHGPPETCDDQSNRHTHDQEGAVHQQPTQDRLDHPGTEEHDFGVLAL